MKNLIFFMILLLEIGYCKAQEPKLILPIGHTDDIQSVSFSQDSKHMVTTSKDNTAKVWETLSGKLLFSIQSSQKAFTQVTFSHNGKWLLTVSDEDTNIEAGISSNTKVISVLKIWNAFTGALAKTLKLEDKVNNVYFSKD